MEEDTPHQNTRRKNQLPKIWNVTVQCLQKKSIQLFIYICFLPESRSLCVYKKINSYAIVHIFFCLSQEGFLVPPHGFSSLINHWDCQPIFVCEYIYVYVYVYVYILYVHTHTHTHTHKQRERERERERDRLLRMTTATQSQPETLIP